jgi:putative transposase
MELNDSINTQFSNCTKTIQPKNLQPATFEPFTQDKLLTLLATHPVTKAGRVYIDSALGEPSRNVAGSLYNQISDIPCAKMQWSSQAESATTEQPITLQHIFDLGVAGYCNQPPPLSLCYQGKNGRTVRTRYTPDCLLLDWREGIFIEEWKPSSDKDSLQEKYPGRFTKSANGTWRSPAIEEAIRPLGFRFRLRFSDEVSAIGHANRTYLYSYLYPSAAGAYQDAVATILQRLGDRLCAKYSDLVLVESDADLLNYLLATSRLHFDFDSALIEREPSEIQVFRHAETLRVWQKAIRPDGSKPILLHTFFEPSRDLQPGDVIVFDGRRMSVSFIGATSLHLVDEQKNFLTLNHHELIGWHKSGLLTLPSQESNSRRQSPFWKASTASLERALSKLELLDRLDRGEVIDIKDRYSNATYRRWRKRIREGSEKRWSPIESLIDAVAERGFRGPHIDPVLSEKMDEWIIERLEDPKSPNVRSIFFELEKRAQADGDQMLSMSSFYERVKRARSLETIKKSQGHKQSYALQPVYWMLDLYTPVHSERALATVHFDSTLLDDEIRSSLSGEILGRPWLSLAICANTRRVVGMYLSFQPPGEISSLMLLCDIIRRYGRIPDSIIHDWGSEFKGRNWKYALVALGIIRHVRPKSAAKFGAVIERIFGVVTRVLLDNIAGNTKNRKNVRKLTPGSDPSNHSGLWLIDLYLGLEEYFFDIYDNRKHPATLVPPRSAFEVSFMTHGLRTHTMRRLEDVLPILMPTAVGKPRGIDPSRGVFVNYRYYGHPKLTKLALAGTTVAVKPLLFDPGSILTFIEGEWMICKSNLSERFSRCPESVRQCVYEELRIEQRLVARADHLSRRQLLNLQERLNRKALENIDYWNDPQAHEVLDITDSAEPTAEPEVVTNLSKIEQRMQAALSDLMRS